MKCLKAMENPCYLRRLLPQLFEALTIRYDENDDGSETQLRKPEKDPRTIARGYQIELCQKALMENIIVYLETGCGKTHIAVLLIYETIRRMKMTKKDICIFLAPTVALVEQQGKVIKDSIDVKVGVYCGSSNHLKGHRDWDKEMEQFEVLVMTPQILLHNLSHCFIRIQHIALLIFDECHYAQVESSHPYAEIMKIFYKPDVAKLPRIFGMTASPIFGKGASIGSMPSMHTLIKNIEDFSMLKNTKKALQRLHCNLEFCLQNLGLWGALQVHARNYQPYRRRSFYSVSAFGFGSIQADWDRKIDCICRRGLTSRDDGGSSGEVLRVRCEERWNIESDICYLKNKRSPALMVTGYDSSPV
ncbi:hypothetical protein L1987_14305 [Smallanthus sonchifolius]|uniref:Uncharacterized protein n=1 Tax=Smallanthus sonchifolius TaxID=185202 RepID=A0ACB9J5X4_9ASTR|nr:hypothetical protein L1987_14305 [Smallanthus sonchifolius]